MPLYRIADDRFDGLTRTTFAEAGITERGHLQRFLRERADVFDTDLLLIAEEFSDWEDSQRRIDLLGVDRDGTLVVVELKRGAGEHMELQALRYAAMVSDMTLDRAVRAFTAPNGLGPDDEAEARQALQDYLTDPSEENFASNVRIVLASETFDPEITTAVLWLNEQGLDIRCVEISSYVDPSGGVLLDVRQIIPLPAADDYRVREKAKRDAVRKEKADVSEAQDRFRRFWGQLIDYALEHDHFTEFHIDATRRVSDNLKRRTGLSVPEVFIGYWFVKTGPNAGAHMGLTIHGNDGVSHAVRSARLAGVRTEIESESGLQIVHFDQNGAGRSSWIYTPVRGAAVDNEDAWGEFIPQMTDALDRFRRAVAPYLHVMDEPGAGSAV